MERQFVNPNFHVILIHYPLGLLTIGVLIELFSFLWRRHSFRAAGRWMILIGTLLAVPTTLSGIYALWDVVNPAHDDATWKDLASNGHLTAPQWKFLIYHLRTEAIATGLSLLAVITWIGASDNWRRKLHVPAFVMLLAAVGTMIVGAWYSGETVYTQGTGVKLVARTDSALPASQPATPPAEADVKTMQEKIEYFASPLQAHAIMAGTTFSIALVSVGLSFRKLFQPHHSPQMDHIAAALEPTYDDTPTEPVATQLHPVSRFWLLASLLAVGTVGGGYYVLATAFDQWNPKELWPAITGSQRLMAHFVAGSALVVLPLILASLARWGYRQRVALMVFSLLLLVAVGWQLWVGILLLVDTAQGVVTKFN